MKQHRWRRIVTACAVLAVAYIGFNTLISGGFMSEPVVLPKMRTQCIGPYLIDLPEGYRLTSGSEVMLYYGLGKDFDTVKVTVPGRRNESASLKKIVGKVVRVLEDYQHFKSPSKNMLAEVKRIGEDMTLVRSYRSPRMLESFKVDLYVRYENVVALFGDKKYTEDTRTLAQVEGHLVDVARNTRYFADPEHAPAGTCLESIAIDAGQDGEQFLAYFLSKEHSDVKFSINLNSLLEKGDGGLLKRVDKAAGMLRLLDITSSTLRRGDRQIAGRAGEELLDAGKDHGKVVRLFTAETLVTEPSTLQRPVLAISMSMGGRNADAKYIDASLSEAEALAWWDAIVSSIRPRDQ